LAIIGLNVELLLDLISGGRTRTDEMRKEPRDRGPDVSALANAIARRRRIPPVAVTVAEIELPVASGDEPAPDPPAAGMHPGGRKARLASFRPG